MAIIDSDDRSSRSREIAFTLFYLPKSTVCLSSFSLNRLRDDSRSFGQHQIHPGLRKVVMITWE